MARLISREFNPAVPVVVRKFFVAAGRHWNPGDVFEWERLCVAQRRVKQLFDAGKLAHTDESTKSDWAGLQARESAAEITPAPAIEDEVQDDTILAAAAEPAALVDDLDGLNMKELRAIAAEIGAPYRLRSEDQREAIREARRGQDQ